MKKITFIAPLNLALGIAVLLGAVTEARAGFDAEPNNTKPKASALSLKYGFDRTKGSLIGSEGDYADWYKFTLTNTSKVWIYVDTGGTLVAETGAPPRDAQVYLYNSLSNDPIESDDNDGTGNGTDDTVETTLSPSIAGRSLSAGTYYIKIEAIGTIGDFPGQSLDIKPYYLYVAATPEQAHAKLEFEPNNDTAHANSLVAITGISIFPTTHVVQGNLSSDSDIDCFSIYAKANTLFYVSVDGDPNRNGSGPDLKLTLLKPDGSVALTANNVGTSSGSDPASEAFAYTALTAGKYFIRVSKVTTTTATDNSYTLLVVRKDPLSFPGLPVVDGNSLSLQWYTEQGAEYQIEATTDFKRWFLVSPVISGTGEIQEFVDVGGASHPRRFYRIRQWDSAL